MCDDFAKQLLSKYILTRNGGVRLPGYPKAPLDGINLETPSTERTRALREEINAMTAHALIRQSEATINRMDNIVVKTIRMALAGQPLHLTGPEINNNIGEARFYSRPLNPIHIEVQGDTIAEFVMYPPEDGLDLTPKVYSTPPLVIPEGFSCLLRYHQLAPGEQAPPPYSNGVLVTTDGVAAVANTDGERRRGPMRPAGPSHPMGVQDQDSQD